MVREALNKSWIALLTRPENEALTELAIRYQSHALFVVNGHIANGSKEHHYKELASLFVELRTLRNESKESKPQVFNRLTTRLVAIASTYHKQRGGRWRSWSIGLLDDFCR